MPARCFAMARMYNIAQILKINEFLKPFTSGAAFGRTLSHSPIHLFDILRKKDYIFIERTVAWLRKEEIVAKMSQVLKVIQRKCSKRMCVALHAEYFNVIVFLRYLEEKYKKVKRVTL